MKRESEGITYHPDTWEPNPFIYVAARLSLWIFPTVKAMLYVEDADKWRIAKNP